MFHGLEMKEICIFWVLPKTGTERKSSFPGNRISLPLQFFSHFIWGLQNRKNLSKDPFYPNLHSGDFWVLLFHCCFVFFLRSPFLGVYITACMIWALPKNCPAVESSQDVKEEWHHLEGMVRDWMAGDNLYIWIVVPTSENSSNKGPGQLT